jgi:hypothetical protein
MSKRMSGVEWEMILDQLEKQTERIDKLETRIKDLENQKINVRIRVKPIESIEYVDLSFVITRSGTFLIS